MFAGSGAGSVRTAAIYSLVGSAKLLGLDPQAYLRHVIERIAEHPINRIEKLRPWRVDLQAERQDCRDAEQTWGCNRLIVTRSRQGPSGELRRVQLCNSLSGSKR